jgi:hypothetical protein
MPLNRSIEIIPASCVGNFARLQLAHPGIGRVMGSTSHGVFCLTASSRIVFLTTEKNPGPLNTFVDSLPALPHADWTAVEMKHTPKLLKFSGLGVQIDLVHAETWQPHKLPALTTTPDQRVELIKLLTSEILGSGRQSIFLPVLKWVLTPQLRIVTPFTSLFEFSEFKARIRLAFIDNEPRQAAIALFLFFGAGPGLTPAGDDFIWGFLLALTRWQSVLCPHFDLDKLSTLLLASARRRTTFLSASLIECASFGWADEGLLSVLDGLFAGEINVQESARIILAYGSSSGLDAFAGIITALRLE